MQIKELILLALSEDIGDGDITSLSCIPENNTAKAHLLVKEDGIIAGIDIAKEIFNILDSSLCFQSFFIDGNKIRKGDIVFTVSGKTRSILSAERLVLNFMQRMSGIATITNKYVESLSGFNTKILDTRKTTPNMRFFEKYAVKIGGGENHRIGLFDMVLIKDNHVDAAGGIKQAINATIKYLKDNKLNVKIEIEARSIDEVKEILSIGGVNRIMLDNFSPKLMKEAILLINRQYETEASGGITFDTLKKYAETGVDYISVGALTHHIKSLDLSLKISN